jgi:hypothetical protein
LRLVCFSAFQHGWLSVHLCQSWFVPIRLVRLKQLVQLRSA